MAGIDTARQPVRWLMALAGLLGAAGVATAAAASHGDARLLGAVSTVCLGHAPALLALALFGLRTRLLGIAAALLAGGTTLFAADLLYRQQTGGSFVALLAPLSGGALIAGWLLLALSALIWQRN